MQPDNEFFEKLRRSYKPAKVLTLFVGESRPANGTFFYLGNSQLYRCMKEAFRGGDEFLCDFERMGFYLDDLVAFPVNDQSTPLRRRHCKDSIESLADRMGKHSPTHVVAIGLGIKNHVARALNQAGMSNIPFDTVRFPSTRDQQELLFLREMQELIPKLSRAL